MSGGDVRWSADDRDDAIAVGAWAIGRGTGDCRMLAQEAGDIPAAYPDRTDPGWQVYARFAGHVIDGLVRAGFVIQHPAASGSDARVSEDRS